MHLWNHMSVVPDPFQGVNSQHSSFGCEDTESFKIKTELSGYRPHGSRCALETKETGEEQKKWDSQIQLNTIVLLNTLAWKQSFLKKTKKGTFKALVSKFLCLFRYSLTCPLFSVLPFLIYIYLCWASEWKVSSHCRISRARHVLHYDSRKQ